MGFGSTAANWDFALFGLAFAPAPLSVSLARHGDSRTHYAKGKRSRPEGRFHSLWTHDFRSVSLRSQRFFSPFPRGTRSLSVIREYSALEGGPPGFGRRFTRTVLVGMPVGSVGISDKGLSPAVARPSSRFSYPFRCHAPVPQPRSASTPVWAPALSLATTRAMSFDLFSFGY